MNDVTADGRRFGWAKIEGATFNPVCAVVIHRDYAGPKLAFVGDLHVMTPAEYELGLRELAEKYPCPPTKE